MIVTKARHVPVLFTCNSTVLWEAQHLCGHSTWSSLSESFFQSKKHLTPSLALSVVSHVLQGNALSHCSEWICTPALESHSPRKHKVLWTILVLRIIHGLFRNANICGSHHRGACAYQCTLSASVILSVFSSQANDFFLLHGCVHAQFSSTCCCYGWKSVLLLESFVHIWCQNLRDDCQHWSCSVRALPI